MLEGFKKPPCPWDDDLQENSLEKSRKNVNNFYNFNAIQPQAA